MPELVPPTACVHASFVTALNEFRAEGRGSPSDSSMIGLELRQPAGRWTEPAFFGRHVRWLLDQALDDPWHSEDVIPFTTLWWVSGYVYLGRIAIRHRLTQRLLDYGGHIGFDVRPSARRHGHATAMLAAALPIAGALNINPVLVTCNEDNVGSRKVIEANRGVLEDKRGDKLRYWVPTF